MSDIYVFKGAMQPSLTKMESGARIFRLKMIDVRVAEQVRVQRSIRRVAEQVRVQQSIKFVGFIALGRLE